MKGIKSSCLISYGRYADVNVGVKPFLGRPSALQGISAIEWAYSKTKVPEWKFRYGPNIRLWTAPCLSSTSNYLRLSHLRKPQSPPVLSEGQNRSGQGSYSGWANCICDLRFRQAYKNHSDQVNNHSSNLYGLLLHISASTEVSCVMHKYKQEGSWQIPILRSMLTNAATSSRQSRYT